MTDEEVKVSRSRNAGPYSRRQRPVLGRGRLECVRGQRGILKGNPKLRPIRSPKFIQPLRIIGERKTQAHNEFFNSIVSLRTF